MIPGVGEILADKYRIDRMLGMGGMGVVLAATHLELDEPRAIKLLLPASLESTGAVERLLREARALARLKSDHVAKVHDVGRLPDGTPYMVMEHLEGSDLSKLLKRRGPLPLDEIALYILQACEALAEAHAAGIVHRDVKPGNLFLTRGTDGAPRIKVLDFGIAHGAGLATQGSDLAMTGTGVIVGSPLYMAPEMMRSPRHVDVQCDIWALGATLYELSTGRPPFRADSIVELVSLAMHTAPPAPSQVRPELSTAFDPIVLRCLEKDPANRYATVAELAAALAPFVPEDALHLSERIARVSSKISIRPGPAAPAPPRELGLDATALSNPTLGGTKPPVTLSATPPAMPRSRASRLRAAGVIVAAGLLFALFWAPSGEQSPQHPAATPASENAAGGVAPGVSTGQPATASPPLPSGPTPAEASARPTVAPEDPGAAAAPSSKRPRNAASADKSGPASPGSGRAGGASPSVGPPKAPAKPPGSARAQPPPRSRHDF